jgi:hypothetical protein
MRRESVQELLDRQSTPLKQSGVGGPPRIIDVPENVTVVESELIVLLEHDVHLLRVADETAVMKCRVEGNPPPTFKWTKGMREVLNGGRFKHLTDGDDGSISLIMQKCRMQDDGAYTLTVENVHGSDSVPVKLLVTQDSGLDFRNVLKHR